MERSVRERVVRTCDPAAIEAELESLWRELADQTPAARAIMSNLVVVQDPAADADEIERAIVDVAEHHASRIIVLVHGNPARQREPVGASVGILLFGPQGTRHGVEQITIRSVCVQEGLPSIVRRLVLGDLPTAVWWTGDLSQTPPIAALVGMGRQFVFDSGRWRDVGAGLATMVALLSQARTPDIVDINWRSFEPLRRAVVRGLRDLNRAGATPTRIQVRHHPRDAARAWLLVGWLGSRAGPLGARHPIAILDRDEAVAQPLSVSIDYGAESALSAEMDDSRVLVKGTSATVPLSVQLPLESIAEAVAAELRSLGRDRALVDAIREAHERLTWPAEPSTGRSRP
jgi:glucose-6-phosphate dehydrogenase assembly protein OpcA